MPSVTPKCEPRRVVMSPEEYRKWYDAEKRAEYEALAEGRSAAPVTGFVVDVVETVDVPRPSEVVREVCAREHAAWVAMRWGNLRRVVAERAVSERAILVEDWPVMVKP
jgi:hypothetical protein